MLDGKVLCDSLTGSIPNIVELFHVRNDTLERLEAPWTTHPTRVDCHGDVGRPSFEPLFTNGAVTVNTIKIRYSRERIDNVLGKGLVRGVLAEPHLGIVVVKRVWHDHKPFGRIARHRLPVRQVFLSVNTGHAVQLTA